MEGFFLPLFFFLFLLRVPSIHAQDDVCADKDCGKGTCVPKGTSFDCVCYEGWAKLQIGPLTFPSCVIPNCTVNLDCGSSAPPAPPAPPPPPPPPFNLFSPCNLVWCGDGSCVVDGLGYYCQCNEGSANLLNLSTVACFKQCSFGADCRGLGLGPPVPPSPPPSNGSDNISIKSGSCGGFSMSVLSAVILAVIIM